MERVTMKNRQSSTFHSSVMGSRSVCILCMLLCACPARVQPEMFSSTAELKQLATSEAQLLDDMEQFLSDEEKRLKEIKEKLDGIRSGLGSDVDKRLDHPIDAMQLIKRWAEISTEAKTRGYSGFEVKMPDERDYTGAINAILRLQITYQLPTAELARGSVHGVLATSPPLAPSDMLQIGRVARKHHYKLAREWLQLALHTAEERSVRGDVLWELLLLYQTVDDYESALKVADLALEAEPENPSRLLNVTRIRSSLLEEYEKAQREDGVVTSIWESVSNRGRGTYEALCRGDKTNYDSRLERTLFCQYKTGLLPYVRYKEEVFYLAPRISMFYEVISDAEADHMRQLAYPRLYRSRVGDASNAKTSDRRVGKLTWLWDSDLSPIIHKLSRRVEDATGLSTQYRQVKSSAEPFQVVNYGIGGQYEPHYDFCKNKSALLHQPEYLMNAGDRLTTFMFYLSDVQAGGATVFPEIGVRVAPIKNSAAFWFNILPNGSSDGRTLHAGCPVLLGQKWVANKWIREWGQELRRPCGARQVDLDDSKGVLHKCAKC